MRWQPGLVLGFLVTLPVGPASASAQTDPDVLRHGLVAVDGIRVGQFTLDERPTGCTVIIADGGAVGGVDVRGSAPGTRETDLLDPQNMVQHVNAVLLSGGSAYGLAAADGVMDYLEERGEGFRVGRAGVVPIVVGAILFDLGVGDSSVRPGPECGYKAAEAASTGPIAEGSVGAGAGATVGKFGRGRSMKGGVGTASFTRDDGLVVAALVAINSVGDVIDPETGSIVAGALTEDGEFADARALLREGGSMDVQPGANTTIAVIATNATLTKAEATKVAQMAHDGFARAIYPAHTMGDGDTIFTLATGAYDGGASVTVVGALAADVMAQAILRAVREATGLPGIPSVRDLAGGH